MRRIQIALWDFVGEGLGVGKAQEVGYVRERKGEGLEGVGREDEGLERHSGCVKSWERFS